MDYTEDSIYYSDEDSFDDDDSTPVCVGCQCQQKICENLMPSTGSVLWGSTEWDVQDYIDLHLQLLTIGVRLYYQCSRCLSCEDCIPANRMFCRSVEYEERRQINMPCASPLQVGCLMSNLYIFFIRFNLINKQLIWL